MSDEQPNGHNPPEDLPEIETSSPEAYPNHIPGLGNVLYQPNSGRGMWDPIERAMRGSTDSEDFLRLTRVRPGAVGRHKRIQYTKNLARFGNGRLEDCMWSGYNLSCSEGGWLIEQVVSMVTGQRQKRALDWQQKRRQIFENARSNNPMADNEQRLNAA